MNTCDTCSDTTSCLTCDSVNDFRKIDNGQYIYLINTFKFLFNLKFLKFIDVSV